MKKFLSNILLLIISFVFTIICLESILRFSGYSPGCFENDEIMKSITINFKTKSVYPVNFFQPDSMGILRVVHDSLLHKNTGNDIMLKKYQYYFDNLEINKQGFRGNDFKLKDKNKKIILCGDSYTWGYSAMPIDSCFADLLQLWLPDIKIYNAGLPGVDVVTYKKTLEILLPEIKPDIVIINFFAGNDFIYFDKKLTPWVNNDVYLMNVGGIMKVNYDSYDKDSVELFSTYLDAYNYYKNKYFVTESTGVKKLIRKSSLFTQCYKLGQSKEDAYYNVKVDKFKKDNFATVKCLSDIQKLCNQYGAKLIISIIPDEKDVMDLNKLSQLLIRDFSAKVKYNLINELQLNDYAPEAFDTHFNNQGHRKYAGYLLQLIDSTNLDKH